MTNSQNVRRLVAAAGIIAAASLASGGISAPAQGQSRPTARVSAKVVAYNEHDQESGEAFTAKPNQVLYPGETKGKWTFVETDDGDAGWVLTSQLDLDGGGS